MDKWWVLYLKDGKFISVKSDNKDEAKRIAWESFSIAWFDIIKFELYYR